MRAISPRSAPSSPAQIRSRVVFPAPFSPTIASASPRQTSNDTFVNTWRLLYDLSTPRTDNATGPSIRPPTLMTAELPFGSTVVVVRPGGQRQSVPPGSGSVPGAIGGGHARFRTVGFGGSSENVDSTHC